MTPRRPYIGGNWKMNTTFSSAVDLARGVAGGVESFRDPSSPQVVVFPPYPYLLGVSSVLRDRGPQVHLGAQNVSNEPEGAFTGEVSASMLRDCGCEWVLTGHSERRHVIGETDEMVGFKTAAALSAGLGVVLCIGETLDQREKHQTDAVNKRQLLAGLAGLTADDLLSLVIAYEPVWAIGTGKAATPQDAQNAHHAIRGVIAERFGDDAARAIRVIYGGSVKAGNAAELFAQPDIDGGLIGGASLDAAGFCAIASAAKAQAH